MQSVQEMPLDIAAAVTCVLVDIDDTLTTGGRLSAAAYMALEKLYDAGLYVVPITGRPAGWCDMIARFWPVHGVVGENGAFFFAYDRIDKQMKRGYFASETKRKLNRERLEGIRDRILKEVPESAISADQFYREADLAIDFCEDIPALDTASVERIKTIFEEEGATAKLSSIHVNGWYGAYDKLSMSRRFLSEILDLDIDKMREQIIYCGDSPNDEPMFEVFSNACGVANILDFEAQLTAKPRWIASFRGGAGFVEISDVILKARGFSQ